MESLGLGLNESIFSLAVYSSYESYRTLSISSSFIKWAENNLTIVKTHEDKVPYVLYKASFFNNLFFKTLISVLNFSMQSSLSLQFSNLIIENHKDMVFTRCILESKDSKKWLAIPSSFPLQESVQRWDDSASWR